MLPLPVAGYSLDLQKAHTDFAEAKIGKRIIERQLEDEEINQLAVVAMAGATSEGMKYPEVGGQVLLGFRFVCLRAAPCAPLGLIALTSCCVFELQLPWGGGGGVGLAGDAQASAHKDH